jgi:murein L,D-transpeptidase YafK
LKRSVVRALLASAAVAAAIALAGCNPSDVPTNGRAMAPLSDRMLSEIKEKRMDKDSPILVRLFKEESELEVWKKNQDGEYALLKTYPICRWSGDLGPKKKEGDRQAPEGFYTITPGQMNPNSSYYLAFNTGFPNAYDRSWGYTGSELMVHGDCSSRGCYAMTDEQIQEIYALARESFFGGQKAFQLEAFPFRMTALNMAKHRNNPNFAFWKMLKEGYDHFEATKQEPKVAVCEKRYVFDPAAPDNATKPLSFNPSGACPAYQLDKNIADAVLDHTRQEQYKMAQYIAEGVGTAPSRSGIDGGMNPVFASKLGTQEGYDSNGRLVEVATAPGSLPRSGGIPATIVVPPAQPQTQPVVMASAPAEEAAASARKPSSIGGLIGTMFKGSEKTKTASAESEPVALRGSSSDLAAKPKQTNYRATSTPSAFPKAPVPKAAAKSEPDEKPSLKQATAEPAPASDARTAYAAPQQSQQSQTNGALSGAQPVVPAGNFDSRWGFR